MLSAGTSLDLAFDAVRSCREDLHSQQRFHAVLLRSTFYVPCLKPEEDTETLTPLRLHHENNVFFIAFDDALKLQSWIGENSEILAALSIRILEAKDLLKVLGNTAYLAINPGTQYYIELNPEHLAYLQQAINEIEHQVALQEAVND